jgi:adenylate cyclase
LACEKFGRETLVFRYLDRIVVKGRTQPVGVYEIVGLREYVSDEAVEGIQIFETGLNAYFERDWDAALAAFERSSALEIHRPGEDVSAELNPSLVLSHRCRMLRSNPPPPDWNGVFTMREK